MKTDSIAIELVVVDNASTDDTEEAVHRGLARLPFPGHLVTEPLAGVSRAKNRGVSASSGDLIAFTDDDCYPDVAWAENIVAFFRSNPEADVVAGHVTLHDPEDYPFTITEGSVPSFIKAGRVLGSSVHGCNIVVRREAFEAVGGFDIFLGPGTSTNAAEDKDFLYRLARRAAGGLRYDASIRVAHHHRRKMSDVDRLWADYQVGIGAFFYKHSQRFDFVAIATMIRITWGWVCDWRVPRARRPVVWGRTIIKYVSRGRTAYKSAMKSL